MRKRANDAVIPCEDGTRLKEATHARHGITGGSARAARAIKNRDALAAPIARNYRPTTQQTYRSTFSSQGPGGTAKSLELAAQQLRQSLPEQLHFERLGEHTPNSVFGELLRIELTSEASHHHDRQVGPDFRQPTAQLEP